MLGIVIIDYGSQYTALIARRVRELGYCSEIILPTESPTYIEPCAYILSGGPGFAGDVKLPKELNDSSKPILGICYGMQLLIASDGGTITSGDQRSFGEERITIDKRLKIFAGLPETLSVWMSHADHVSETSDSWRVIARDSRRGVVGVVHKSGKRWGLQFHPEVSHTEHGTRILHNFCQSLGKKNWQPVNQVDFLTNRIKQQMAGDGLVLQAVSGGVDSTVATLLTVKALGKERVRCVFIDNGLLRSDEVEGVRSHLNQQLPGLDIVDCQDYFLEKLAGVIDPEEKRKAIGRAFIDKFKEFASNSEQEITHLGQGTLYADVIESGGYGVTAKIKSHHNVGGLPDELGFTLLEPLRFLFKDEVRAIGKVLGLPEGILQRQPFPGPGLAVRILGEVTAERLVVLRQADKIFRLALHKHDFYQQIWQSFCVLIPTASTGVMGDRRVRGATIVLRAVTSKDAMTAKVFPLPADFLMSVADQITSQVEGITRVVYDLTSKPPATIEWE